MRRMRLDSGFTLRRVEELSGVSNAYVSQMEHGVVAEPSPKLLWLLAMTYAPPGGQELHRAYRTLFLAAGYRIPMEARAPQHAQLD